jgi:hypothetical protein
MDIKAWLERLTERASVNAVATTAGIDQSTLNRQLKTGSLSPENVVKIARAYNEAPLVGLVELGLITAKEAGADELRSVIVEEVKAARLDTMSQSEITAEMRRLVDEVDRRSTGKGGDDDGAPAPGKREPLGRRKGQRVDVGGTDPIVRSRAKASRGDS